ncbi:unnamed protein product [Amoebophrya sp. A25]|nr:unnamed protein product [Amoebophrya sp. A25]|eukprot:GSA25T00025399001.1
MENVSTCIGDSSDGSQEEEEDEDAESDSALATNEEDDDQAVSNDFDGNGAAAGEDVSDRPDLPEADEESTSDDTYSSSCESRDEEGFYFSELENTSESAESSSADSDSEDACCSRKFENKTNLLRKKEANLAAHSRSTKRARKEKHNSVRSADGMEKSEDSLDADEMGMNGDEDDLVWHVYSKDDTCIFVPNDDWEKPARVVISKDDFTKERINGETVQHLVIEFKSKCEELHVRKAGLGLKNYFPNLLSFTYHWNWGSPGGDVDWSALRHLTQIKKLVLDCGCASHQNENVKGLTSGILPLKDTLEHLEIGTFRLGDFRFLKMCEQLVNLRFLCHAGVIVGNAHRKLLKTGLSLDLTKLTHLQCLKITGYNHDTDFGCQGFYLPGAETHDTENPYYYVRFDGRTVRCEEDYRIALHLPIAIDEMNKSGGEERVDTAGAVHAEKHLPRPKCLICFGDPAKSISPKLYEAFSTVGGKYHSNYRLLSLHQYAKALGDPDVHFVMP